MYVFSFNRFGGPMFVRDPNAELVLLVFVVAINNLRLLRFHNDFS